MVDKRINLTDLSIFTQGQEFSSFETLRNEAPLHWSDESNGEGFWSLTRYADVKAAASDTQRLSNAFGTQIVSRKAEGELSSLHNLDDPEHANLRRILVPRLRAVSIKTWQEVIDESVAGLLDEAGAAGSFDLVERISVRLPMLVLSRVMGVPSADAPRMVDWTNRLLSAESGDARAESLAAARGDLMEYFQWLTEERRRAPENDLISALVHGAVDDRPLTWDQLAAYYILIVAAGNETTRHLVSGATIALHEYGGSWRQLADEPDLFGTTVQEMFRYVSPVASMRRTATEPIEMHGGRIEPGDKVVLWFASANRDPDVFDNPDSFVLDRSENEHLAFGWGVHFCMGTHLARAEVVTYFREIIARGWQFEVTGQPVRLEHNLFRGWTSVPVSVRSI